MCPARGPWLKSLAWVACTLCNPTDTDTVFCCDVACMNLWSEPCHTPRQISTHGSCSDGVYCTCIVHDLSQIGECKAAERWRAGLTSTSCTVQYEKPPAHIGATIEYSTVSLESIPPGASQPSAVQYCTIHEPLYSTKYVSVVGACVQIISSKLLLVAIVKRLFGFCGIPCQAPTECVTCMGK